jgi:pimeloyl-ACP methyl ester carboxylesterase
MDSWRICTRRKSVSLYVDESGTPGAPAIVFLHGVGASGWMWFRQLAALADFHCLTVDLPGHGRSAHMPWHSLADTSDEVAEVIRSRAAGARAHVVGLSLGGHVALLLLERHAQAVSHVVISGITAEPIPGRALIQPQVWLMTALSRSRRLAASQAKSMGVPPDMQDTFIGNLRAMSMQAYRRILHEVVDSRLSPALAKAETPVLVAAGSRESKIILRAVEAVPRLMPNATGVLAPGVGHGWNVEAPELFSAMVRAWITGAPLPAALHCVDPVR